MNRFIWLLLLLPVQLWADAWQPSSSYTGGQSIVDSNGNVEVAVGSQTATITNIQIDDQLVTGPPVSHKRIVTLFFSASTPLSVVSNVFLSLAGLTTVSSLNGGGATITTIMSPLQVQLTYSFAGTLPPVTPYSAETGTATTGNGITGTTQPTWALTSGAVTIDGGAQWVNHGLFQPDRSITGWCHAGATKANTSGLSSNNTLQGIIPSCRVTVFQTGTTTLATIHADGSQTPLSNPFTANNIGQWTFWAQPGVGYDIVLSGGIPPNMYTSPVTLSAIMVGGGGGGGSTAPGGNNQELQFNANGFFEGATGLTWDAVNALLKYPGGGISANTLSATNGISAGSITATGAVNAASLTAGVINGPIAPTQVTWPPTCTGGMVYNPSNNSCVATGTANNPAGANGQLQFNSGGFFAATANASLDSSGNLTAANVNGVYDLKAAFGASASQQTMTCTATAGSNNLTCSGGTADFKVGSTVYIQAAGNNATISTPAAPTVTCAVYNSGSCAGSVVYGYEIGALQGSPNGAMTVLGPATTITQSAQGAYQRANGGAAYTVTTVTWPTVSGVSKWVVYKNVNGGPYQFYTFVDSGQTLNDNGHPQMGGGSLFTCVDLAIPCTAPTGATPDDVFAKITAISGPTVTLGPETYPAKRWVPGVETTYPFTPGVSGTFTVQHDDTPAFTAAYIALQSSDPDNTPSTLHIPFGTFLTHNEDPYGFAGVIRGTNLNNVTIIGEGPASRIIQSNDRAGIHGTFSLFQCGGSNSTLPSSGCLSYTGNQPTHGVVPAGAYPLSDPVIKGSVQVTMASTADAAHFTAGEYVSIFIMAADPTYPANMYGELNRIKKVDTTAGILTLEYPASKMYSATLNPPYSVCTNCALPAYIGPVTPQATVHNWTMKSFYYRGYNMFLNYNGVDGLTLENLTLYVHMLETEGFSRHQIIRNNTVYDADLGRTMVENADASADAVVEGNHYIDMAFASVGQTCSEGSANVQVRNNVFDLSGNTYNDALSGIMGADLCYDFDVADNSVNVNNASILDFFGVAGYSSGQLRDTIFTTDSTSVQGASFSLSGGLPSYFTVKNNRWKNSANIPMAWAFNNTDVDNVSNYTLPPQSGATAIYSWYANVTMFTIPMSGNITSMNLGANRYPGYHFILDFVQPASGGPYSLPSDCTGGKWVTAGNPLDCPNGYAPVAATAANSHTVLRFYDDGTTVHWVGGNVDPPKQLTLSSTPVLGGTSGSVQIYAIYGQYQMYTVAMTGNITTMNIGGTRKANYSFSIAFTQPASGGPFGGPADCAPVHWGPTMDCPGGVPPLLNPAPSSMTVVQFFDDGTIVHVTSSSYHPGAYAFGSQTLVSGTVTVNNAAACSPSASCVYKLTNCAKNSSTAIGTLAITGATAGTNFTITSLTATATTATGDLSTVCWQIN